MVCCWKQLSPAPLLSLFFMALVSCGGSSGDDTSRARPRPPSPSSPKVTIDQSLKEISPLSTKNYVVSGKCDSSLQTKVVVTLGQPNVQVTLDCQADDTFMGEVDIRRIVSNPATITVTQSNPSNPQASGYSATSDLVNHIVPLVLDQLTPLETSYAASYRAIGNCESAFGDVRIKIEDQALNFNISKSIACSSSSSNLNTFRADLNIARSLAGPITIQLAQGPQDLDLRTANLNYTLIASAPPSLSINPLAVLNSATAKAYAVTGTCDSSIQQQVALTLLEDNQVSGMSDCQSNNTFSIGLDAITLQDLPSSNLPTLTFQITHGNKSLDSPLLTNNIIHLKIDESVLAILNLAHASTYVITGKCDPSLGTDNVEIEMGTGGIATPQTTSCDAVNSTFSESLDASDITEKPTVSITVTHKGQEARATVQNNIVPLSINESALAPFNLNSSASYTVTGECDSSLGGSVEVSVIGANITDSATCNSNNTFTVDLNGSSLTISTITFQATYGGKTVNSKSIENRIVRFQSISAGGDHTCALTTDGKIKCWGSAFYGQLGNGNTSNQSTPVDVHTSADNQDSLSDIAAISTGFSHTCALTTDDKVKCWGDGRSGRLGDGNTSGKQPTPVDVHTSADNQDSLSDIAAISSGESHTCALTTLTTGGNVKCWGSGNSGRLGDGSTSGQQSAPVDVHTSADNQDSLSDIAAISTGGSHTCALTIDGKVKCWGQGNYGQLGNKNTSIQSAPVDVHTSADNQDSLSDIAAISTGGNHTCALTTDGKVKCWGAGSNGRLGDGNTSGKQSAPVNVHTSSTNPDDSLSDIAAIITGSYHTCALTTGGNVKCWGQGTYGQLGNKNTSVQSAPVNVHTSSTNPDSLSDIATISSMSYHTCAITTNGNAKCWGKGAYGKLGNGNTINKLTPVDILLP